MKMGCSVQAASTVKRMVLREALAVVVLARVAVVLAVVMVVVLAVVLAVVVGMVAGGRKGRGMRRRMQRMRMMMRNPQRRRMRMMMRNPQRMRMMMMGMKMGQQMILGQMVLLMVLLMVVVVGGAALLAGMAALLRLARGWEGCMEPRLEPIVAMVLAKVVGTTATQGGCLVGVVGQVGLGFGLVGGYGWFWLHSLSSQAEKAEKT
jgi:hypothetical protein